MKRRLSTLNARNNPMAKFTKAWMADDKGNSVEIDAHMQAGEDAEDQVDEYAFYMLDKYVQKVHDSELEWALNIAIQDAILGDIAQVYDYGDEVEPDLQGSDPESIRVDQYVADLVERENVYPILRHLGNFSGESDLNDLLSYYEDNVADYAEEAMRYIHMRLDRTFMRVRVGGLKDHEITGAHEINFRVPDTRPESWYKAISNFLADHPNYIGYELFIYSELVADNPILMEEFNSGMEFMDLKASRTLYTPRQLHKLDSAYRRDRFRNRRR